MKIIKYALSLSVMVLTIFGCANDDDNTDFVNQIEAPKNVALDVRVTQDNTGLVTLIPSGEGATYFVISFGDNSGTSEDIQPGNRITHTYEEGTYEVVLSAYGLNGKSTELVQPINVSFQAPENLDVIIENDGTISKTVNVTATADFAMFYEVSFGEDPAAEPMSANIGETISFTYQDAGIYTIQVEAFGAAIETTTYTEEFEVTAIVQPLASAPTPPSRAEEDVISIFSAAYNNEPGTNYFPDWGQGGCCGSGWAMFDLAGDEMLQYTNLSYQGNELGAPVDVSQMEYIHLDVWTADVLQTIEVTLISESNGERPVVVTLEQNAWTSIDIPISDYTDQTGFTVADIFQLKYVGDPSGEGTVFIDNVYFYKEPSAADSLVGVWRIAPEAGSLGVGPILGDIGWFNCDAVCITERSCQYDDLFVFNSDGSFNNVLGSQTWVEDWQGGSNACGVPVAPHDGSNPATYTYDEGAGTVTLNGTGAFIGVPKANNAGELSSPADAPGSITYNVNFIDMNTISVYIEAGPGVFWQYRLIRDIDPVSALTGTWQLTPEAGSLGVGPALGDVSWYSCDAACVADRACQYDDLFVFNSDGSFNNVLGSETWVEDWQGGSNTCGAPVAPHDGSNPATFNYDIGSGTVTLNGTGAFIGIPKAVNSGELTNPADTPESVTYNIAFIDANNINVSIEAGPGVFWQYKLVKI